MLSEHLQLRLLPLRMPLAKEMLLLPKFSRYSARSVRDFSSSEDYRVAEDKVDDEKQILEAVEKIAQRSAERLVSQMTSDF